MALGTNKITASATTGVAAAASSRVGTGGRNVASVSQYRVEDLSFAPNIGVNEESMLHYQDQSKFEGGGGGRKRQEERGTQFTPLITRGAFGFKVEEAEEATLAGEAPVFLTDVMRGVGTYESNMRATSPITVRPGSVMNYMY
jgi:hypothetical protein